MKPKDLDELSYAIIGAIFEVNHVLGPGFLEKVYENALCVELEKRGLNAQAQCPVQVKYKGQIVGDYIADIVVENKVVLELKTVDDLTSVHIAQLLNYLQATRMPLGLLVNFKDKKAKIRRVVLDAD